MVREVQVPAISMERTSRPKGSVPRRPAASGGFSRSAIWMRVGLSGVQTRERSGDQDEGAGDGAAGDERGGPAARGAQGEGRCGGLLAHALALSRGSSSR